MLSALRRDTYAHLTGHTKKTCATRRGLAVMSDSSPNEARRTLATKPGRKSAPARDLIIPLHDALDDVWEEDWASSEEEGGGGWEGGCGSAGGGARGALVRSQEYQEDEEAEGDVEEAARRRAVEEAAKKYDSVHLCPICKIASLGKLPGDEGYCECCGQGLCVCVCVLRVCVGKGEIVCVCVCVCVCDGVGGCGLHSCVCLSVCMYVCMYACVLCRTSSGNHMYTQ